MTTTIASFPAAEYIYLPTKYRIPLLFFEYLPETALTCSFLPSAPARTARLMILDRIFSDVDSYFIFFANSSTDFDLNASPIHFFSTSKSPCSSI